MKRMTAGVMSPFHESVLRDGPVEDGSIKKVFVPPNPALRLFNPLRTETERTKDIKAAKDAIQGTKRADLSTWLIYDMCVLGQVGDPSRKVWVLGVSVAPSVAEASEPQYFRVMPEHLIGLYTPQQHRGSKHLKVNLLKGTDNSRTVPSATWRLPVPDLTAASATTGPTTYFDWIEFDPRIVIVQFIKSLGIGEKRGAKAAAGDGTNEEDEEDENDADNTVTPPTTIAAATASSTKVPTAPTVTTAAVAPAKTPARKRAVKAPVFTTLADEQDTANTVVANALEGGKFRVSHSSRLAGEPAALLRPGYFPASFDVSLEEVQRTIAALDAPTDDVPIRAQLLFDILLVAVHYGDLAGVALDRAQSESTASLSTLSLPTLMAHMRTDKGHTHSDLVHLITEEQMAADMLCELCTKLPAFLAHAARIAAVAAMSEKYMGCRSAVADAPVEGAERYCALSGRLIAAGEPCLTQLFVHMDNGVPKTLRLTIRETVKRSDFAPPPPPLPSVVVKPVVANEVPVSVSSPPQKKRQPKQKRETPPAPAPETSERPTKKQKVRATDDVTTAVVTTTPPPVAAFTPYWGKLPGAMPMLQYHVDFSAHLQRVVQYAMTTADVATDGALKRIFAAPDIATLTKVLDEEMVKLQAAGYKSPLSVLFTFIKLFVSERDAASLAQRPVTVLEATETGAYNVMGHFCKRAGRFTIDTQLGTLGTTLPEKLSVYELAVVRRLFGMFRPVSTAF